MPRIYYFECDDCGFSWENPQLDRCPECGSIKIIDMSREMDDD
jgi:predicted Zn-ribbon and HTH transcriptional regulator